VRGALGAAPRGPSLEAQRSSGDRPRAIYIRLRPVFGAVYAPFWLLALIIAGAAPSAVGALQSAMERRARRRTFDAITRAGLTLANEGVERPPERGRREEGPQRQDEGEPK
jgi:hypothetical protein